MTLHLHTTKSIFFRNGLYSQCIQSGWIFARPKASSIVMTQFELTADNIKSKTIYFSATECLRQCLVGVNIALKKVKNDHGKVDVDSIDIIIAIFSICINTRQAPLKSVVLGIESSLQSTAQSPAANAYCIMITSQEPNMLCSGFSKSPPSLN